MAEEHGGLDFGGEREKPSKGFAGQSEEFGFYSRCASLSSSTYP